MVLHFYSSVLVINNFTIVFGYNQYMEMIDASQVVIMTITLPISLNSIYNIILSEQTYYSHFCSCQRYTLSSLEIRVKDGGGSKHTYSGTWYWVLGN